ncbi:MAG TPA: thiamine pyrophosphate-binding protein [Bacillota bacterium]
MPDVIATDPYAALHEAIKACGVRLVACLPDDWMAPLITRLAADPEITSVRVARESEAVAVATGAFFTGTRSAVLIGATGLFTCTGELATLNLRHQIPVFLLVSERGSLDDLRIYQEVQGRRLKPVLEALDFPHFRVDSLEAVARLPQAYEWGRLQKRPVVAFLARTLLKKDAGRGLR